MELAQRAVDVGPGAGAAGDEAESRNDGAVTRRNLLRLGLVGGASAVIAGQLTQQSAHLRTEEALGALETELLAQAAVDVSATRDMLQARIDRLERELALYRALDRTGLDNLISGVLDLWETVWAGVRSTAARLRGAVASADERIEEWDRRISILGEALSFWRGLLDTADEQLDRVRGLLGRVIERTAPVAETVEGFFDWVLARIPFGLGESLREGTDGVTLVMTSLPDLLKGSRDRVLQPLTDNWVHEEEGLRPRLFTYLRATVLSPIGSHLDALEGLADSWREGSSASVRQALDERRALREEIAALQEAEPVALSMSQRDRTG